MVGDQPLPSNITTMPPCSLYGKARRAKKKF
jgi:hypothetical protein